MGCSRPRRRPRRKEPSNMDSTTALATPLAELGAQARGYLEHSKATNTRRAYAADWRTFTAWCNGHQLASLPATAETVALFLVDHAGVRKASTLQRYLVSIAHAHEAAGVDPPTTSPAVRAVWAGIRRRHGTAQVGKAPAQVDELRQMVGALGGDLRGLRDRA